MSETIEFKSPEAASVFAEQSLLQLHAAKARIAELEAKLTAAENERLRVDAARYRWLRECSPFASNRGAVTINWPVYENGRLQQSQRDIWGSDLDAAIDSALAKPNTGGGE